MASRASAPASRGPKHAASRRIASFTEDPSPSRRSRLVSRTAPGGSFVNDARDLLGVRQQLGGRQHGVRDPHDHRLVRREGLAEQQFLRRARATRDLRQQQGRGEFRHQPEARERHRKRRVVRGIDEVAMQQHRHADADGHAVHRRDHRLLERRDAEHEGQHGRIRLRELRVREVLEVVAGGEGAAGARDQHRAHGRIGRGLLQAGDELLVHLGRDRVLLRGAVEGQPGDALVRLVGDAHMSSSV